jgi:hypothetical protein
MSKIAIFGTLAEVVRKYRPTGSTGDWNRMFRSGDFWRFGIFLRGIEQKLDDGLRAMACARWTVAGKWSGGSLSEAWGDAAWAGAADCAASAARVFAAGLCCASG